MSFVFWAIVFLPILIIVLGISSCCNKGKPQKVTIATGTEGGTFSAIGKQLANILERLPESKIECAKAEESKGSIENIERLVEKKADIAFVSKSALIHAEDRKRKDIRILTKLYKDAVHVLVNNKIEKLSELEGEKIYIGADESATQVVAKNILHILKIRYEKAPKNIESYNNAVQSLIKGEIKAVFMLAGAPIQAIKNATDEERKNLKLLDLYKDETTKNTLKKGLEDLGFEEFSIKSNTYNFGENHDAINTIGTDVFMVCRSNLSKNLGKLILQALFDNIYDILLAHTSAEDIKPIKAVPNKSNKNKNEIKFYSSFDNLNLPEDFKLHGGAKEFKKDEKGTLIIATGAPYGKYFQLGQIIQVLLKNKGIRSRVIHTDGSLENAYLLSSGEWPTLALMQYEVALASYFGTPKFVYGEGFAEEFKKENKEFPNLKKLRLITFLHEEKVHVLIRKELVEKLAKKNQKKTIDDITIWKSLKEEKGLKICLGPELSGTHLLGKVILKEHNIPIENNHISSSSASDMVNQLINGKVQLGFFVSYVPSEALKTVLNDKRFRLLSLNPQARARIIGQYLKTAQIDSNKYLCQAGEEPIQTIATRAVLVTTENLDSKFGIDIKKVTSAIIEGSQFLGIKDGFKAMDSVVQPIPLHPEAKKYFEEKGLLPSKSWEGFLKILSILVGILATTFTLSIWISHFRNGRKFGKEILMVNIAHQNNDSVRQLLGIRKKIEDIFRKPGWKLFGLDIGRWRYLYDLINDRIKDAKENLTRHFILKIHGIGKEKKGPKKIAEECDIIEQKIWRFFKRGELDEAQKKMLLEFIKLKKTE